MNSRRFLLNEAAAQLTAAGASDAALDAQWLLAHCLRMPRLRLLMALEEAVPGDTARAYRALVARRAAHEPLQYVLGEADFMGHTFRVDSRVLIPRADTETLCEAAIARLQVGGSALEIGAGSGAVAISVALACPAARVAAVDISGDALAVARANGARLGAGVRWAQGDLLAPFAGERFDVILSNPPYIESGALLTLQREVRREPQLALDGGADGLDFYRRILRVLPEHLCEGGALLLEVGDGQAVAVSAMMEEHFAKIDTLRDLAGLARVVTGDGYAG